jgi:hypothetical protein
MAERVLAVPFGHEPSLSLLYSDEKCAILLFMNSTSWYKKHPGKKREHRNRWKVKKCGSLAAYARLERRLYPNMNKRSCRKWYQNNRTYSILLHTMRTRKLLSQWRQLSTAAKLKMRKIYERCQWWRQKGFDVVVDHKRPLAKGGKHHPNNLQIIYRSENQLKKDKLNFTPSVIFL